MKAKSLNLPIEEIINRYLNGASSSIIANDFGCNKSTISRLLSNNGIVMRDNSHARRLYTVDENFFDIIDTEEKAYVLGFLYADGCNHQPSNTIIINLQEKDVDILYKISQCLKSNRPIKHINTDIGSNIYRLCITNKHISNKLAELGCIQAKSLILKFPTEEQVPYYLTHHFIRGYFDGDGSIGMYKTKAFSFSIEGCKYIIEDIQDKLMKSCNLKQTKLKKRHKERESSISVEYGGKHQVIRILNYLYKDSSIYLDRKYEKFQEMLLK